MALLKAKKHIFGKYLTQEPLKKVLLIFKICSAPKILEENLILTYFKDYYCTIKTRPFETNYV